MANNNDLSIANDWPVEMTELCNELASTYSNNTFFISEFIIMRHFSV